MSTTNKNAIAKTPNSSVLGAWYYLQGSLVFVYGIWISISELSADYTGPQRDIWDCVWSCLAASLSGLFYCLRSAFLVRWQQSSNWPQNWFLQIFCAIPMDMDNSRVRERRRTALAPAGARV